MDVLKETLAITHRGMTKKEIAQHLINVVAIERFHKTQTDLMKVFLPDEKSRTHITKIMRMIEGTNFEIVYVLISLGVSVHGEYWGIKTRLTEERVSMIDNILDTFLELTWCPRDRVPIKEIKKVIGEHFEVADEILTQQHITTDGGSYVGVRLL